MDGINLLAIEWSLQARVGISIDRQIVNNFCTSTTWNYEGRKGNEFTVWDSEYILIYLDNKF